MNALPWNSQGKLLRALQQKEIVRVGGTHAVECDVAVIASSNTCLREEVARGQFRLDLYHRLKMLEIVLPPLRARGGDVLRLAAGILEKLAAKHGCAACGLHPETEELLLAHHWPGNVRELENILEHALLVALYADAQPDAILPDCLPEELRTPTQDIGMYLGPRGDFGAVGTASPNTDAHRPALMKDDRADGPAYGIDDYWHDAIRQSLERNTWNLTRTAQELGISRSTLYRKMHAYGLCPRKGFS